MLTSEYGPVPGQIAASDQSPSDTNAITIMTTTSKRNFLFAALTATLALGACDNSVDYNAPADPACADDEFVGADGECDKRTYSVDENADYSRYVGGGTAAFSVNGVDAADVSVLLNGEEVTPAMVGNRLFVSIPRGTGDNVELLFGEEAGESTTFSRSVGSIELLESEEAVVNTQRSDTSVLLDGTEAKVSALQNDAPVGLLEASEAVKTGLGNKIGLLQGDETLVAAEELEVLVPIMLKSQEAPMNASEAIATANKIVALDRLRKQENETCDGVIADLTRINDTLAFEAGSLLSIATPLIVSGEYASVAEVLAGVGWTYWIDDMLAFLEGVDQFATICATNTYEAQLNGGAAIDASVESGATSELSVAVTREFGDEAANLAKQELKPLIDLVMDTVGGFYGGFEVDVEYLDQSVLTGTLAAGSIAVSVPSDSGVTATTVVEGDSLFLTLTLDSDVTTAQTVEVTIADLVRDDEFTVSVEVTPAKASGDDDVDDND